MNALDIIRGIYTNLASPSIRALLVYAYAFGTIFFVFGLYRIYLHGRYPERLMGKMATVITVFGGAVILALPAYLDAGGQSVFGQTNSPGSILSYLGTPYLQNETTKLLWNFISWLFTLFGAWAFMWSWVVLARSAEPANTTYRWESGALQMFFGLLLYFNELWLLAFARTLQLIN